MISLIIFTTMPSSADNQMSDDKDDSVGNRRLNPFQTWSTHELPIIIISIIMMISIKSITAGTINIIAKLEPYLGTWNMQEATM